jgi:drug/metabolite transporter (DMT)-like permease
VPDGAAGFTLRLWGVMAPEAWIWTVAQAGLALIAVGLIIRAYQVGEASFVAVYEYALLVFAVLWGWLLRGETVDAWAMAGIAAIVASGAVITLRERAAAGPADRGVAGATTEPPAR